MTDSLFPRIGAPAALAAWRAGAILIDVRSAAGRQKNGEAQGAIIVAKSDVVDFVTRRLPAGGGQKVILFCGSVAGSGPLVAQLAAAGVADVADVDGGFAALTGEGGLALHPAPA